MLADVNDLRARPDFLAAIPDDLSLAGYLGSVENGRPFGTLAGDSGVGTSGGTEDHTAILVSVAGHLTCYRYHPVAPERRIALGREVVFVVAASGITADKTGGARDRYNRASSLAADIVARSSETQAGTALHDPRRRARRLTRRAGQSARGDRAFVAV